MKIKKKFVVALGSLFLLANISPALGDWHLESINSPSGLSAYASTYWINGVGPVNYKGLSYYNLPYETYFASQMIQCTRKKYIVTMSLFQTGSSHDDLTLDDPRFIKLQFLNSKLNKKSTYRTYGTGSEGTLAINSNTQDLINNVVKSHNLKMQFMKRSGEVLSASFDVRDLVLAKTRFQYAGCTV